MGCFLSLGYGLEIQPHESAYTPLVKSLVTTWPPKNAEYQQLKEGAQTQLTLLCASTTNEPYYIGLVQVMLIEAPMSNIIKILNYLPEYHSLFLGFKEISYTNLAPTISLIHWVQETPFFIPSIFYDTYFFSETLPNGNHYFRQQLKNPSPTLLTTDSLIILEPLSATLTRYSEVDYFKVDIGLVRNIISPEAIWLPCIEGNLKSDLAVKTKAENPTWSYRAIYQAVNKKMKVYDAQKLFKARKELVW